MIGERSWTKSAKKIGITGEREPDISFFISSMGDGGAQRTIANLTAGFAKRDYTVDLLLLSKTGPYLRDIPEAVRIFELATNRAITSVPFLAYYLRRASPDIFFSTMEHLNIVTLMASIISNTQTNIIIRASNVRTVSSDKGVKPCVQNLLARELYPYASELIALSEYVRGDVARNYDIDPNLITVIYNPVNIRNIQEMAKESLDGAVFGDSSDVIITVGRLSKQKDISTILRAFAQISDSRDIELIILGKGNEEEKLNRLAQDLGIMGEVHFLGFVDNPFKYMSMADVFVLSSRWEGFGNVLVEAMACGTPVVSTDCPGGPSEILSNGKYGELVPVGDSKALARAIERTLTSPPDDSLLIRRAGDFDSDRITSKYEELLFRS